MVNKRNSDILFALIKSLSRGEKKVISQSFSHTKNGKETQYTELFNRLDKLEKYDEDGFKKSLGESQLLKNFSYNKHYLYNYILNTIQQRNTELSAESTLNDILQKIEVLFNKTLYKQCARLLNKGVKIAERHELFLYLLLFRKWEKKIAREKFQLKIALKKTTVLHQDIELLINKYQNLENYDHLALQMFYLSRRYLYARTPKIKKMYADLVSSPLFQNEEAALSVSARINYHYTMGLYYYLAQGDFSKSLEHFIQRYPLIEEQYQRERNKAGDLIDNFHMILLMMLRQKNYSEIQKYLEKIKSVKTETTFEEIRQFLSYRTLKILYFVYSGQFEEAAQEETAITAGMNKYGKGVHSAAQVYFYFYLFRAYFGLDQFNVAKKWLNKTLNHEDLPSQENLESVAKICNIILCFELQDYNYLETLLRSYYRHYKGEKKISKFEKEILELIKATTRLNYYSEDMPSFFKKAKLRLLNIRSGNAEEMIFDDFDFISWLESKITGESLESVVRKKTTIPAN